MKLEVRRAIVFAGLITLALLTTACGSTGEERKGCLPPPDDFQETDLVGIWWAGTGYAGRVDDYLEIRADRTYKQTIFIEYIDVPSVYYESDWLPWWIEYFDDGIPYLHLEGLRLCAHNPDISCDQAGGGPEDWHAFNQGKWIDYCKETMVLQENEGILMIKSAPNSDNIELAGLGITPLDTWIYELQSREIIISTLP